MQLTEQMIRIAVGPATFERGAGYQRRGAVGDLRVTGRSVWADVQGTERRPYAVELSLDAHHGMVHGICSCPMAVNCKHVAAVALSLLFRAQQSVAAPGPASWERDLQRWLPPVEPTGPSTRRPLGLRFAMSGAPGRYSTEPDPSWRLTPVTVGRRGDWVQQGVSWRELEYGAYGDLARHPGREPLLALAQVIRSRSSGYYAQNEPVRLDAGGPMVWAALDDLVDARVSLVVERSGPVDLVRIPVTVGLDVRRDVDQIALQVSLAGPDTVPPADAAPIGDPAFGLWAYVDQDDGSADRSQHQHPRLLRLWRLERRLDPLLAGLLGIGEPLLIPATDLPTFQAGYLPRLRRTVDVRSVDGSVELPEAAAPRVLVRAGYEPGHQVLVEWLFRYRIGDQVHDLPMSGGPGPSIVRDPDAEERALDALELGRRELAGLCVRVGDRHLPVPQQRLSGFQTVTFSTVMVPVLQEMDLDLEMVGTAAEYRASVSAPDIRIDVTDASDRDWFDLDVAITVDGTPIPFAPLFAALAAGEPLLLDDGLMIDVDCPEFRQLAHLIEQARLLVDRDGTGLRVSPLHAGLWEELVALGVVGEQSDRWQQAVRGLLDLAQLPTPEPPTGLQAQLRPYQLTGYHWLSLLVTRGMGGILADDMGLGKTVQALALIQQRRQDGERRPVLVVAPTSVVGNWATEAGRFTPGLTVAVVSATARRRGSTLVEAIAGADIVVTSYALLRLEFEDYHALDWSLLVLDEAQMVKNHRAKTYQSVRRLDIDSKIAVTGTPLENNLMELWSLLSIVAPGLFPDPKRFADDYAKPIEGGTAPELLRLLRRRIRPLMLRRTKELVAADLPPKQEQVLTVDLDPRHRRIYDTHLQRERQRTLGLLNDLPRNRIAVLASLTRLRQLALSASLVEPSLEAVGSAKIDTLVEHLHELAAEGHRALVFSQFTRFLGQVRDRLVREGIGHVYLDGRTRDRPRRIAEFTDGTAPAFLISLKAGGFGLNLTAADYCFVLDPWWNPAAEAQAVDRTHRIGQTRTVMVYRLISAGTIEEKVLRLQQGKRELFASVIDDGDLMGGALTADDLRGLLG